MNATNKETERPSIISLIVMWIVMALLFWGACELTSYLWHRGNDVVAIVWEAGVEAAKHIKIDIQIGK